MAMKIMLSQDGQGEGGVLTWASARFGGWDKFLAWRIDRRWGWLGLKAKEIKRGLNKKSNARS